MLGIFAIRCVECLRWYAAASVLRCSHLNRALYKSMEFSMDDRKAKDVWDKASSLSGLIASVLIPVALAFVGHWSTEAMKNKEISAKYTELAIDVLKKPSTTQDRPLRAWATDILNVHSGVQLTSETREFLIDNQLVVSFVDNDWTPEFSKVLAENFVESEVWKKLVSGGLTKEKQIELLQDVFKIHSDTIADKKKKLQNDFIGDTPIDSMKSP